MGGRCGCLKGVRCCSSGPGVGVVSWDQRHEWTPENEIRIDERGATIGGLHHGGLTWTKSPIVERGDSRKEPGARRAAVCAVSQLPSRPGRVCDAPGKVQGVLPARLGGATTQGPPALLKLKQSPANVQVTQNEEADDQFRQL